jgi:hypothetical protein
VRELSSDASVTVGTASRVLPDYLRVGSSESVWHSVAELPRRFASHTEQVAGTPSIGGPLVVDLTGAAALSTSEVAAAASVMAGRLAGAVAIMPSGSTVPAQLLDAATVTVQALDGASSADRRVVGCDDLAATLQAVLAAYAQNPMASSVFVQTLRLTSQLSAEDGILAESFAYSTLLGGSEFAAWLDRRGPARPADAPAMPVLLHREADILDIVLNHPARRNAYSAALRDALIEALLVPVVDDGIRLVRLRGNGPAFSSGGDLAEFGTIGDPALGHAIRTTRSVGRLLRQLGDRIEVHLHGACIGAGIEFPVFARRVYAAPDVVIRLPEITMGLIPGAGGTASITARVGRWRTAYLGLTGHAIGAETARSWGLVDDIKAS